MPEMQRARGGKYQPGGILSYPLERVYEEVAFVAYYLHWEPETVVNMPHSERRRWCEEISKINRKLSHEEGTATQGGGMPL